MCTLHNHPPYGTIWACAASCRPSTTKRVPMAAARLLSTVSTKVSCNPPTLAAALARAYSPADMAILTGHGTLVTAHSPTLALLHRAVLGAWARKAWEVKALGLPGVPLLDDIADKVSEGADVYADLLFENYAQRLFASDPDTLVDDITP